MKKLIDDDMLNKIRLDKTLFHIPKSHGSYIDSRTGRLTSSGKMAKEKLYPNQAQVHESEGSGELVPEKIRKCPPKCIVCCAIADPNDKEFRITQTTIYCPTCLVSLCIKKKGNRKASCFEIFHQIPNLSSLKGKSDNNNPSTVNLGASSNRTAGEKRKK